MPTLPPTLSAVMAIRSPPAIAAIETPVIWRPIAATMRAVADDATAQPAASASAAARAIADPAAVNVQPTANLLLNDQRADTQKAMKLNATDTCVTQTS